jgi:hypothetical protein
MHVSDSSAPTIRLSLAFLAGAVSAAAACIAATLSVLPEDLPGRAPSPSELAVLSLWVLALGLGHRWTTRRLTARSAISFGATLSQAVWGAAAFLLLSAITLLIAPVVSIIGARLATATLLANAHLPLQVLLLVPMGIVLAIGTGAATGSLVRPRG